MRDGADSVSRVRHQVSGRNSIGVSSVAREHGIGCIATVKILLSFTFTLLLLSLRRFFYFTLLLPRLI